MRYKAYYGHLAAALLSVVAFHFAWREVTYKLADQVMVYADCEGLQEMVSLRPFGLVDWLISILAATNLTGWGILVQLALFAAASTLAYLALRHRGSKLAPFAPWLTAAIFILPALSLGENIWMLRHPQFPQMHLLWFAVLSACLLAGWKGLLGFVAIPLLLVGVGKWLYYDLPVNEVLWSAMNLPIQDKFDLRSAMVIGILILLIAFVMCPRRRPNSAAFADSLPNWMHLIAPIVFGIAFFVALPGRDTRDQLAMERAVREARFADVLEIAPKKTTPERMETAWRVLAMFRADRLDRDLYRYPIIGSHRDTEEPEMIMGAPLLLFNYGLILPARRWLFEVASAYGWKPQDYRMLGDIALVIGENELALRYFDVLARCPFRGDYAANLLKELAKPGPVENLPPELLEICDMNYAWFKFSEESMFNRFTDFNCRGEADIYALFQRLKSSPPKMFKMMLAASLLDGHPERVRKNRAGLSQLYPNGNIGPAFLSVFK